MWLKLSDEKKLLAHIKHKLSSIFASQMHGILRWAKVVQFGKDLGTQHDAAALEEKEMEDCSESEENEEVV